MPVEATTIRFNDYTTTLTPPDLPDDLPVSPLLVRDGEWIQN
ncbi:MAG: hypothetical protein R2688_04660 [Fimbriimonadaceae bacterium]